MIDKLVVFLPLIGAIIAGIIVFMPSEDKEKQHQRDLLVRESTLSHGPILSS